LHQSANIDKVDLRRKICKKFEEEIQKDETVDARFNKARSNGYQVD